MKAPIARRAVFLVPPKRQQMEYAFRMNALLAKAGKLRPDWFSQDFSPSSDRSMKTIRTLKSSPSLSPALVDHHVELIPTKMGNKFRPAQRD